MPNQYCCSLAELKLLALGLSRLNRELVSEHISLAQVTECGMSDAVGPVFIDTDSHRASHDFQKSIDAEVYFVALLEKLQLSFLQTFHSLWHVSCKECNLSNYPWFAEWNNMVPYVITSSDFLVSMIDGCSVCCPFSMYEGCEAAEGGVWSCEETAEKGLHLYSFACCIPSMQW